MYLYTPLFISSSVSFVCIYDTHTNVCVYMYTSKEPYAGPRIRTLNLHQARLRCLAAPATPAVLQEPRRERLSKAAADERTVEIIGPSSSR